MKRIALACLFLFPIVLLAQQPTAPNRAGRFQLFEATISSAGENPSPLQALFLIDAETGESGFMTCKLVARIPSNLKINLNRDKVVSRAWLWKFHSSAANHI